MCIRDRYRTDLSARDEFRYTHEEGFAATSSGAKGMLTGIAKMCIRDRVSSNMTR